MDKAFRMGKDSATGSIQLFIAKAGSTVILAVGAIILGLLILQADYGLYVIALIPAATISLFQDWGVGSAMTKYCAQFRSANKEMGELRQMIISGLTFEIATGAILTMFSFLTANFIALTIFHKPDVAFLITLMSLTIFFGSVSGTSQAIFVGFERMVLVGCVMICQAVALGVLPVLLVYEGYGAFGAVLGYVLSMLVTCIVSAVLLYVAIFRRLGRNTSNNSNMRQTLKLLLSYGVPLAIANIIGSMLGQFNSFMMASLVSTSMIGNYKIATNFTVLITFFTVPIMTVLLPTFSKIDPRHEPQLLKTVFMASVKYTCLILVPVAMALMVLSKPLIGTLYGDKWFYAPPFLVLSVIGCLLVIFGVYSVPVLFTALGETKRLMKLNLLELTIGIPLAFLLIPRFGIPGLIITTITAGLPGVFISLYWIWKHYGIKVEFRPIGKIFLASSIAAIITYLFQSVFVAAAWMTLTIGVVLFLSTYLAIVPSLGAINQTEVNNLRAISSGSGIMSKLLEIPLIVMEKLL